MAMYRHISRAEMGRIRKYLSYDRDTGLIRSKHTGLPVTPVWSNRTGKHHIPFKTPRTPKVWYPAIWLAAMMSDHEFLMRWQPLDVGPLDGDPLHLWASNLDIVLPDKPRPRNVLGHNPDYRPSQHYDGVRWDAVDEWWEMFWTEHGLHYVISHHTTATEAAEAWDHYAKGKKLKPHLLNFPPPRIFESSCI